MLKWVFIRRNKAKPFSCWTRSGQSSIFLNLEFPKMRHNICMPFPMPRSPAAWNHASIAGVLGCESSKSVAKLSISTPVDFHRRRARVELYQCMQVWAQAWEGRRHGLSWRKCTLARFHRKSFSDEWALRCRTAQYIIHELCRERRSFVVPLLHIGFPTRFSNDQKYLTKDKQTLPSIQANQSICVVHFAYTPLVGWRDLSSHFLPLCWRIVQQRIP